MKEAVLKAGRAVGPWGGGSLNQGAEGGAGRLSELLARMVPYPVGQGRVRKLQFKVGSDT